MQIDDKGVMKDRRSCNISRAVKVRKYHTRLVNVTFYHSIFSSSLIMNSLCLKILQSNYVKYSLYYI